MVSFLALARRASALASALASAATLLVPTLAPAPPTLVAGRRQADLTIGAIKMNGQIPDDKDDCRDGKNAGTAEADDVAVRLAADGAEAGTQAVKGLEAGKEREVRFEGVRLKKGEHTLTATLKATGAKADADQGELKVTVHCKDAA